MKRKITFYEEKGPFQFRFLFGEETQIIGSYNLTLEKVENSFTQKSLRRDALGCQQGPLKFRISIPYGTNATYWWAP